MPFSTLCFCLCYLCILKSFMHSWMTHIDAINYEQNALKAFDIDDDISINPIHTSMIITSFICFDINDNYADNLFILPLITMITSNSFDINDNISNILLVTINIYFPFTTNLNRFIFSNICCFRLLAAHTIFAIIACEL